MKRRTTNEDYRWLLQFTATILAVIAIASGIVATTSGVVEFLFKLVATLLVVPAMVAVLLSGLETSDRIERNRY